jgi:hypothetical protein
MQERMTETQKLTSIVVAPSKAFDAINRRPTWILPLGLLFVFTLLADFVVYRVVVTDANFERIALAKIDWDAHASVPRQSTGSMGQQIEAIKRQRKYWYLLPLAAIPLSVLPLSFFFYLVLLVARAGTTFRKVFAVMCWSFVIYRCVGGIFVIAALLIRGAEGFIPAVPEAWSPTSLAHVISPTAVSPNVYSTISKIDPFLIWWLAVAAIGFSRTSNSLSIARSTAIVAASEAVYLVLNASGVFAGAF